MSLFLLRVLYEYDICITRELLCQLRFGSLGTTFAKAIWSCFMPWVAHLIPEIPSQTAIV